MIASILISVLIIILFCIFFIPVNISLCLDNSLSIKLDIKVVFFDINVSKKIDTFSCEKNIILLRFFFDNRAVINRVIYAVLKCIISLFIKGNKTLHIHLQGGLGSPDITGITVGIIDAIKPFLGNNIAVFCLPDMMSLTATFSFKVNAIVRLYDVFTETLLLICRIPFFTILKLSMRWLRGEYHVCTT